MDFLVFFLGYIGLFSVAAVLVLLAPSSPALSRLVEMIRDSSLKIVYAVTPSFLLRGIQTAVNYVFNTRNHVMQLVFGGLVMGGNVILMRDILPLLYIFEPNENHLFVPMLLLFSNAAAFHLSCTVDAGRVTSQNVTLLSSLYRADGTIYKLGVECSTCQLVKPARSKHCSICNQCVHRFDHHCIWINNCVGAGNLRFFLPFLLTLLAMVINGAVMGTRAMILYTRHLNLLDTGYVDSETGQVFPITIPVLLQHLFMQHPRSVFLVSSLLMLAVLLGLFTLYHGYLVLHNQTTNERYKISALSTTSNGSIRLNGVHASDSDSNRKPLLNKKAQCAEKDRRNNVNNNVDSVNGVRLTVDERHSHALEDLCMFYNKGIWLNVKEVFLPWSGLKTKAIEKKSFTFPKKKLKRQ